MGRKYREIIAMSSKMYRKITVSIIIVHYLVKDELFACIKSVENSEAKISYEIIIVDNGEKKSIEKEIKRKFPKVRYIKNPVNNGYSGGNNLGAQKAGGKYLLFLNPDTLVERNTIERLESYLKKHKSAAIVAPALFDLNGNKVPQGTGALGFLEGIFCLSFLNKLFPNNKISKRFFLRDIDKDKAYPAKTVAGTALMIRRNVFDELDGFDEHFFLFFEEFDICRRVRDLGYKIAILPSSKIKHVWGSSMKKSRYDIADIFRKSRFYYFKKYYGFPAAIIVESVTRLSKYSMLLLIVLAIGIFLRFFNLASYVYLIGDYGWFYLSARDMLLNGDIPLVGIPSSRSWLHQGPFWTYLLALGLRVSNYHPIGGAVIASGFGVLGIIAIYFFGKLYVSSRVGFIAALIYATSPLIVLSDRTPYHTSPIPFFTTLLFISLHQWIRESAWWFVILIGVLAILYNFEIATVVLWFPLLFVIMLGLKNRSSWLTGISKKFVILISLCTVVGIMFPMILYDISHGFVQTGKFLLWIPYRVVSIFFNVASMPSYKTDFVATSELLYRTIGDLVLPQIRPIGVYVFGLSVLLLIVNVVRKKKIETGVLLLFLIAAMIGIVVNATPSDAYVPLLFPMIVLTLSFGVDYLMRVFGKRHIIWLIVIALCVGNVISLLANRFTLHKAEDNVVRLPEQISAAKEIIRQSDGQQYSLSAEIGSNTHPSYTMHYEYLLWWLGHEPSKHREKNHFYILDKSDRVSIRNVISK